jgi:dolichol-phosphate mannosyltransferase
MRAPSISIIIPAFNEAESIESVVSEAFDVFDAAFDSFEVIVVDDGSGDDTAGALKQFAVSENRLRVIRHPNRAGKSAALRTGMLAGRALWAATMDGDGQDDPRSVVEMANAVDLSQVGEVGLVAGCRTNRTDGANRKFASRLANGLRRSLLNDDCPDTACGLKLIVRDLFLALPFFDALHRYLPALSRHLGFDIVCVPVVNRARSAGSSKYSNLGRAAAGLFDLMGVIWLMRRTHTPSRTLILRGHAETQGR